MATPTLKAVGFCAHYSDQGDWAFDYALKLARANSLSLNVFHFLDDPYSDDKIGDNLWPEERARLAIQKEKELRMYYDERAGDYLNVGFRLCEHAAWTELHRCLVIHEFQVLVLGYVARGIKFGQTPIEDFAQKFISPVVLVGPKGSKQIYLNRSAMFKKEELGLKNKSWMDWRMIKTPPKGRYLGCSSISK